MSPSARELTGPFIPEGATFVVSADGAQRINEHLGSEHVSAGDEIAYAPSYQERIGGPPMFEDPVGETLTVPEDLDAFASVGNLPNWFDPEEWQEAKHPAGS